MTKIIKATFDESLVTFNSDGWINATAISDNYGKKPVDWLRLPSTVEYMEELGAIGYKNLVKTTSGRGGGTYIHPVMAVDFMGWIGGAKAKAMMAKTVAVSRTVIDAIVNIDIPDDIPDMYVYAIMEQETGRVKIGISKNPESRVKQLQTGNSQKLELVAFRKAENRYKDEAEIHNANKHHLVRGEWFDGDVNFLLGVN